MKMPAGKVQNWRTWWRCLDCPFAAEDCGDHGKAFRVAGENDPASKANNHVKQTGHRVEQISQTTAICEMHEVPELPALSARQKVAPWLAAHFAPWQLLIVLLAVPFAAGVWAHVLWTWARS